MGLVLGPQGRGGEEEEEEEGEEGGEGEERRRCTNISNKVLIQF